MEIVDGQLHPNRVGPRGSQMSPLAHVEAAISAMDAVGVDAVLLDEWAGWTEDGRCLPGIDLPSGIRRITYQVSELAVELYPSRFAYCARFDIRDPDLPELMAGVRNHPGRLALRWFPQHGRGSVLRGSDGHAIVESREESALYHRYFELAEERQLPVFLVIPNDAPLLIPFARAHPGVQFVIDHCGVSYPLASQRDPHRFDGLGGVIALAEEPNVALKWCHAPRLSLEGFPYPDVLSEFRRVLAAFGKERVVWASDYTQAINPDRLVRKFTWTESLEYIRRSDLTQSEKEWVLGKAIRSILRWGPPS